MHMILRRVFKYFRESLYYNKYSASDVLYMYLDILRIFPSFVYSHPMVAHLTNFNDLQIRYNTYNHRLALILEVFTKISSTPSKLVREKTNFLFKFQLTIAIFGTRIK